MRRGLLAGLLTCLAVAVAALPERAIPHMLDRARRLGVPVGHVAPPPGG